jgi:predicted ATPase
MADPVSLPVLVPMTVARALAPPPGIPFEEDLARHLRPRQLLLLLDNCEHVLAAVGDLIAPLLVTCPALHVLATSRAPLRIRGEQEIPVEPMPLPPADALTLEALMRNDAVRLFVERARSVLPAFAIDEGNAATIASEMSRTAPITQHLHLPLTGNE